MNLLFVVITLILSPVSLSMYIYHTSALPTVHALKIATLRRWHQTMASPGSHKIFPLDLVGEVSCRQAERILCRVDIACLSEVKIPNCSHSVTTGSGEKACYICNSGVAKNQRKVFRNKRLQLGGRNAYRKAITEEAERAAASDDKRKLYQMLKGISRRLAEVGEVLLDRYLRQARRICRWVRSYGCATGKGSLVPSDRESTARRDQGSQIIK